MKRILLITDGACIGNPGPGGWACILRFGGIRKEIFGFDPHTTDSEYLIHGITKWIAAWKRRSWWRKKEPVRNADLWMELDGLAALQSVTWVWTKGHAGHEDNNRCDWLAQNAAATQRSSWADGRPHLPMRLNLGADYVPPKPQAGLFDMDEAGAEDDHEEEFPV